MSSPSQELLKQLFNYREDGELIQKKKTSIRVCVGDVAGCIFDHGYRLIHIKGKFYYSHRLIWMFHYGYLPENQIDHINRIKSDNRIENLREVTQSCNMRNIGNLRNNTSGVKGVCFNKRSNKWGVTIQVLSKRKSVGAHIDFNEAVLHRLAAEQCLDWDGCDSSSPAYQYALKHNLIKRGM